MADLPIDRIARLMRHSTAASARLPSLEIVEQPADQCRFRYRRECRTNGSIPGISSTAANKIHPKIKVNNFVGPAIIRVSCVTKDAPHRPHPHKLVGKSNKSKGGECNFKVDITAENPMVEIKNIGIQCMKRDECQDSLQDRARKGIDPFRTGFGSTERIDLHSVRLAFELLPGFQDDEGRGQLPVVTVSNVISGTKSQLVIFDTCPPCGLTRGGDKMILLTEKLVSSDVLSVVFAEKGRKLEEIWKESVEITSKSVHKQHALLIETPPYSGTTTTGPIKVVVYLQRALTGDEAMDRNRTSNSVPYEYMPEYAPRNKRVSSLLLPDPEQAMKRQWSHAKLRRSHTTESQSVQPKEEIKIEPDIELKNEPGLFFKEIPPASDDEQDWLDVAGADTRDYLKEAELQLRFDLPDLWQPPPCTEPPQSYAPSVHFSGLGECVPQSPVTIQQPYSLPLPHVQTPNPLDQFKPSHVTNAHFSGWGECVPQSPLPAQQPYSSPLNLHMQTPTTLGQLKPSHVANAHFSGLGEYVPQSPLPAQQPYSSPVHLHTQTPTPLGQLKPSHVTNAHFSGLGEYVPQSPLPAQQPYSSPVHLHMQTPTPLDQLKPSHETNVHFSGLGEYVPQSPLPAQQPYSSPLNLHMQTPTPLGQLKPSHVTNAPFSGLGECVPQSPIPVQQQYTSPSLAHMQTPTPMAQFPPSHTTHTLQQQDLCSPSHVPNVHSSGLGLSVPQPPLTAQHYVSHSRVQTQTLAPMGKLSISHTINAHFSDLGQPVLQSSLTAQTHAFVRQRTLLNTPNDHSSGMGQGVPLNMSLTAQQQQSRIVGQTSPNISHDFPHPNPSHAPSPMGYSHLMGHSPMNHSTGLGHGVQNVPDLMQQNNVQILDAITVDTVLQAAAASPQHMELMELSLSGEPYAEQHLSDSFSKLLTCDYNRDAALRCAREFE